METFLNTKISSKNMNTNKFDESDLPTYYQIMGPKIILVHTQRPGIVKSYDSMAQVRSDAEFAHVNESESPYITYNLADYKDKASNAVNAQIERTGLSGRLINIGSERIFRDLGNVIVDPKERKLI